MKIKTNLSITFLSILCLFAIANAEIGFGISDVGTISSITGIEDETEMPVKYCLNQNYPNPFNPSTKIKFTIPKVESVKLQVYNTLGQIVGNLVEDKLQAGLHEFKFNASHLPSGVYFFRLQAGRYVDVKKMILLK